MQRSDATPLKSGANTTGIKGTCLESLDYVIHFFLLILVFAAIGLYFMTPSERTRLLRVLGTALRKAKNVATVGAVGGIAVARGLNQRIPHLRRLTAATAAVVAVAILYAVMMPEAPLNESRDVRPEIDRLIAVESRTARLYEDEIDRFRKGRIKTAALADVIEKGILPELHAVAGRLRALQNVPSEQQRLLASAEQFLKLRDESWRLRATALHKSDMSGLRKADMKEVASLQAFHLLKMPG